MNARDTWNRTAAIVGAVAMLLAIGTAAWAHDDDDDKKGPSVYYVTLTNTNFGHGFSFPVAATHSVGFHMF
jgi:hypothetical protein